MSARGHDGARPEGVHGGRPDGAPDGRPEGPAVTVARDAREMRSASAAIAADGETLVGHVRRMESQIEGLFARRYSFNTPPVPAITAPSSALTWAVNDRIDFAGGASDGEDGAIPATGL